MQFLQQSREIFAALFRITAQGVHSVEVAAGCAAETEIDTFGIKRFESAELFGDNQRCVIGQHDATATHANSAGGCGDVADKYGRCRASQTRDGMMFRHPIALAAPLFDVACQVN